MVDTIRKIKCPACQKEMTRIFFPNEGINLDICLDGCGGIYFDNRELDKFDEQHEDIQPLLDAIKGKTFNSVDDSLPRNCPACGARMVKHFLSIKEEIQIDDCYSCGGKFFDNGELQKMRAQYKTEAERQAAIQEFIDVTVGADIKALDAQVEAKRKMRSSDKKLFDTIFNICYSSSN